MPLCRTFGSGRTAFSSWRCHVPCQLRGEELVSPDTCATTVLVAVVRAPATGPYPTVNECLPGASHEVTR